MSADEGYAAGLTLVKRFPKAREVLVLGNASAAKFLARRGIKTTLVSSQHLSALLRVRVLDPQDRPAIQEAARRAQVVIDGLGRVLPWLEITAPIIAVGLPSGVTSELGELTGPVWPAHYTVTRRYQLAHLLPPASYVCGTVIALEDGGPQLTARQIRQFWPIPGKDDHKYTRGVLGVLTGSQQYPGAGVLSVAGALAAGPGMVRYLGASPQVIARFPEVVLGEGQVDAWVIGSGLVEMQRPTEIIGAALGKVPIVLDAGAILVGAAAGTIITPHAGELAALLSSRGEPWTRKQVEDHLARAALRANELTGATVVAKSATTVIAHNGAISFAQKGSPWAATAGSGDVLAGILGTILAANANLAPDVAAASAVFIHAQAAVAKRPITAMDIARAVPTVLERILQ